jgi:hypothetical protein
LRESPKDPVKFHYSLYGLRLSSNQDILGPEPGPAVAACDVRIWLGTRPSSVQAERAGAVRYLSPSQDAQGVPTLTVWEHAADPAFHFVYGDDTEFFVDRLGREVWVSWPEHLTLADAATYLLGPVMGFVLRLHGTTCLHASAVAIDERAVALVGLPGAGKSTTAAAFAERGWPVLSDDIVALQDGGNEFLVQPGYPRICLWPDAAGPVCGPSEDLPRLTPNWEKRYLDLNSAGRRFQRTPLPLAAIYILGPRSAEREAPRVEGLGPAAAWMDLIANTYTNYLLDREMRAREFDLLGRIANRLPLRRMQPHQDPTHLGRLCEAILDDFQSRGEARSAPATQQD